MTELAAACGVPRAVARALVLREVDRPETLDRFLAPRLSGIRDPFLLPDMAPAVARIRAALDDGRRVVVFGDYDVDGVTATALLSRVLQALGGDVTPFIPNRLDEGYGLGADALDRCLADHAPHLIVTVDCGTNSVASVRRAAAQGVDVVITDHHEPAEEVAPAAAVVNPKLGDDAEFRNLAGVGVAFKLAYALVKDLRDRGGEPPPGFDLRDSLDLVALGTIADMVPLTGENRILARAGLERLNRRPAPGIEALARAAGVKPPLDEKHVGFFLGPRLNAAGRLETAMDALHLLTGDGDRTPEELARELDAANRDRQAIEASILREAEAMVLDRQTQGDLHGIVVASDTWHPGVVGIVASRLVRRFYRPCIVIALDGESGRGSGRSIPGFDLAESLRDCDDLLAAHGGHQQAAGLSIEAGRVDDFRERFDECVRQQLREEDLIPQLELDGWLEPGEIDEALVAHLDVLRPFGQENPQPLWAVRGVRVIGQPRIVGNRHLKLQLGYGGQQWSAIGFGMKDVEIPPSPLDVAVYPEMNEFRGRRSLQLRLAALRPAEG